MSRNLAFITQAAVALAVVAPLCIAAGLIQKWLESWGALTIGLFAPYEAVGPVGFFVLAGLTPVWVGLLWVLRERTGVLLASAFALVSVSLFSLGALLQSQYWLVETDELLGGVSRARTERALQDFARLAPFDPDAAAALFAPDAVLKSDWTGESRSLQGREEIASYLAGVPKNAVLRIGEPRLREEVVDDYVGYETPLTLTVGEEVRDCRMVSVVHEEIRHLDVQCD